ncbi:MAG TPA: twin-arginine translocase TatA/TatE family subunit [Solirubrobacteraceae bacterium]|nr:twin-arginine translocase TatA/TatE family subunit [Solirubrobacteraceae bacterium]
MGLDNPLHIAFLVVILLLVFGARRLPEMGRSLGSGMREFKDSITGEAKAPTQATTQATIAPGPQPPAAAPAATEAAPVRTEAAPSEPTPSA